MPSLGVSSLIPGWPTNWELAPMRRPGASAEFGLLRGAMTSTLQHAQIGAPRTDCVTILVGHHAG